MLAVSMSPDKVAEVEEYAGVVSGSKKEYDIDGVEEPM